MPLCPRGRGVPVKELVPLAGGARRSDAVAGTKSTSVGLGGRSYGL